MSEELCRHCKNSVRLRNPSGICDHLNYPENCAWCRAYGVVPPNVVPIVGVAKPDAELSALRQENYRLKVALKQALGAVVALLEDIKTPCVQEAVAAIRPFLTEEKAEEKKP